MCEYDEYDIYDDDIYYERHMIRQGVCPHCRNIVGADELHRNNGVCDDCYENIKRFEEELEENI